MTTWTFFFFLNVCKFIRNKERKCNTFLSIHSLCSILCCGTMPAITASSLLEYEATSLAHLSLASSPIPLYRTSRAPSGWMGSVGAQPLSDPFRDVQWDSSLGSGWATLGHSQSCPEATPLISAVCSDQRNLFLMVWESFRCLLANPRQAAMCLLLRSGFY